MMGIPCNDPSLIFGDNQSVLNNSSIPDSILKKKNHSCTYHYIREGCAQDEWRLAYIKSDLNPSDLLTKLLPYGEKRSRHVKMLIHHVEDDHDSGET